ncbi:MAG: NADH-quinone oxidoreductase subunit M [Gammaproteobacteria bacterium]|jgi:NADH-quinone oxidoreductase subunit M|nr:MAG: NADH:ubiquinone oxidoreductase subunit M [Gammaproteobacteria bacterium SG8_31]
MEFPVLSTQIWIPILGGLAVIAVGDSRAVLVRWLALGVSLLALAAGLPLFANFDRTTAAMQFVERHAWIDRFNVEYYLGVDGLSMPLILLTTFVTVLVIIGSWDMVKTRASQYFGAFLIMEGVMNGVFASLDAMLFYVFWEAMLIPMFIIIGIWGGPRRIYATLKFFLYTFLGSVMMLVTLIYLYVASGSYAIQDFYAFPLGMREQILIFVALLTAFAVKVPMWPVHTWLPDAHVEAPTGGSVILAAIMLKMGGYGFVRFTLPIAPDASMALDWLILTLSLIAIVYVGFVALVQTDMKKLIAYSSIAHMGFVTLGFFLAFSILRRSGGLEGAAMGLEGGMVQMVSHGLVSGALFFCVGVLYDRLHSREIDAYGGVANTMPRFAALMVLFAMANAGLPGTSGFVGEFLVILASFRANPWFAFLAATTLILGAAYTLWMVKRVLYGEVANEGVAGLEDIGRRETLVLGILAAAILVLGVWPAPLLDVMGPTIENLLELMVRSKL